MALRIKALLEQTRSGPLLIGILSSSMMGSVWIANMIAHLGTSLSCISLNADLFVSFWMHPRRTSLLARGCLGGSTIMFLLKRNTLLIYALLRKKRPKKCTCSSMSVAESSRPAVPAKRMWPVSPGEMNLLRPLAAALWAMGLLGGDCSPPGRELKEQSSTPILCWKCLLISKSLICT